jgi:hypothetical protein
VSNQSSVAGQRAYANFSGLQPAGRLVDDNNNKRITHFTFWAKWENSGTTPAKNAVGRINYRRTTDAMRRDLAFDFSDQGTIPDAPYIIGPKGTINSPPIAVPIQDVQDQINGRLHLYVYGWTAYDDIFKGNRHLTEFCVELVNFHSTNAIDITDMASLTDALPITCPQHNCYEEDCQDYKQRTR